MTVEEIFINFQRAEEQVAKLRAIATKVESLGQDDMGGAIAKLKTDWTGENAEAFLLKAFKLQKKVNVTASQIRQIADTMEAMAKRIRDAELKAISIIC